MGFRVDGADGKEEADSAAPAERGVFRAERRRASSLLGSLASSSVVLEFEVGGGGDLVRDAFLSLRRSLAVLRLAIVVAFAAAAFQIVVETYEK